MTEDTPGDGAQRDTALVHAMFAALVRAARAARIYLPNNEVRITFKNELVEQLEVTLEAWGELPLQIRPGEIWCEDNLVFRDVGSGGTVVAKLHEDGMRRLVFRPGVTEEELEGLIEVLNTDYEDDTNLEDDLVTKVWEQDFENIEITISEELLSAADIWDPEAIDPEKVASYLQYDGATAGPPEAEEGEDDAAAPPAPGASFLGPLRPSTYLHTVTFEELKELEKVVEEFRRTEPLLEFNELIFEIMDGHRSGSEIRVLLDTAARNLAALAARGYYEIAAETVERLRSVALLLDVPDVNVAGVVAEILGRTSGPVVNTALDYAEQAMDIRTEDLVHYLKSLEPAVVEQLFDRLATTKKPHVRAALTEAITEHCREEVDRLGARLTADPSSPITRDLLAILAAIGDPRGLRYFRRFLGHADPTVRAEVVRSLAKVDSPEVPGLLVGLLKDTHERIRLAATRQLAYRKDPRVLDAIKERIDDPDFDRLSLTEQRYLFTAVAVLGGDDVVVYLARFLEEATGFGSRGSPRGLNAVHALVTIATASARNVLSRAAGSGPKSVREAATRALERLGTPKSPERT